MATNINLQNKQVTNKQTNQLVSTESWCGNVKHHEELF